MKPVTTSLIALLIASFFPCAAGAHVIAQRIQRINIHIDFGGDVLVKSNKTVSIRAHCISNDGGFDRLRVYGTTTQSTGVAIDGDDDLTGNGGSWLTSTTPEANSRLMENVVTTGGTNWGNNIDDGFILDTVTKRGFLFDGETSIVAIDPTGCYLSMGVEKINKFRHKDK